MTKLTERQRALLDFVRAYTTSHGYSPTMREIAEALGYRSIGSVHYQVGQLEARGLIRRSTNRSRTFKVVGEASTALAVQRGDAPLSAEADEVVPVPLLGQIAAGLPLLAEQAVEDTFPLPRRLVGYGDLFLLRVLGDSMIEGAILDGDWVVVRQQSDAENGAVVAALLDGEATVKILQRRGGGAWLIPQNPAYDPLPADEARILGIVVAVLRRT